MAVFSLGKYFARYGEFRNSQLTQMKRDKTIARYYTVGISSVFRSSAKIHFSRTRTIRVRMLTRRRSRSRGTDRERSTKYYNSIRGFRLTLRKGVEAESALRSRRSGLCIAGRGFENGADRAFTPLPQYKPDKHVSIINKKHDELGYTHTDAAPRRAVGDRATN